MVCFMYVPLSFINSEDLSNEKWGSGERRERRGKREERIIANVSGVAGLIHLFFEGKNSNPRGERIGG